QAIGVMEGRESALLVPIVLGCLAIGLFPQPLIKTAEPEIKYVAGLAKEARERQEGKQTTPPVPADDSGQGLLPPSPPKRGRGVGGEGVASSSPSPPTPLPRFGGEGSKTVSLPRSGGERRESGATLGTE